MASYRVRLDGDELLFGSWRQPRGAPWIVLVKLKMHDVSGVLRIFIPRNVAMPIKCLPVFLLGWF